MNFQQRVRSVQRATNSLLCVGLDIDRTKIPPSLRRSPNPSLSFASKIIDATRDLVCAYKVNLAFFEADGIAGMRTLEKILELVPSSVLTIGDGKRGDIGNTSAQYAKSMFEGFGFDATTVSPYMGKDSVEPFLEYRNRGTFVLVLTSNKGSGDFQRVMSNGKPLYDRVARTLRGWDKKKNVGAVVGATHAKELEKVRKILTDMPILIPGVGAQGGDVEESTRAGITKRGDLAVINVSRAVLYASSGKDFADSARIHAEYFRRRINFARGIPR